MAADLTYIHVPSHVLSSSFIRERLWTGRVFDDVSGQVVAELLVPSPRPPPMAAVEASTPNGFDSNNAPTPEEVEPQNGDGSDNGDLFGDDESIQEPQANNIRTLDDQELDSGDDVDRDDRVADTLEDENHDIETEQREIKIVEVDLARVRPPEGNELYLMNLPPFIGLNGRNFDYPTYEPPTEPHDASARAKSTDADKKFSAFSTATSTIYWRRDPKDPSRMQSNARILRWSDGSLTLQLASRPTEQYTISTSALRQTYDIKRNESRPAPTNQPYDVNRDTHNYLATPHHTSGLDVQIVRPIDAALRIQKSGDLASESINRLKSELARAGNIGNPLDTITKIKKDPEQLRREAEQAEKDAARAQRKLENAQFRNNTRRDAVLGRSGLGGRSNVGLSVGGLEDDEGMPSARGTRRPGTKKTGAGGKLRKTNRHGEIYSDDEDETLPRGRTREDEYDREDDFLVDSEEEPETYEDDELPEDDDDEDAGGEDDDDGVAATAAAAPERKPQVLERRERQGTPKRAAQDDDDHDEAGATQASPQVRKKRRVIDSDEEDD